MKKSYLFALTVILCLILLVSCSSGGENETDTQKSNSDTSSEVGNGNDDNPDDDYNVIESDTSDSADACTHVPGETYAVVEPTFEAVGYTEYICSECGKSFRADYTAPLSHSYSSEWSCDEEGHWNTCIDEGYDTLKANEGGHAFVDEVVKDSSPEATGTMRSTCSVCNYSFESVIPRKNHIVSLPNVDDSKCFVGMPLSMIELVGGEASVSGSFSWKDPEARLYENGSYEIIFTPANSEFSELSSEISINASWLTVDISSGSNGEASVVGGNKVRYGDDATLNLIPRFGYAVDTFTINGTKKDATVNYTIENVTSDTSVYVTFKKSDNAVSVNCVSGSNGCYSISGGTLIISGISCDTVYSISGEAFGNIVIDVSSDYKFELELAGFKLTSVNAAPITVLNGDKVTISAKKSYSNYITDLRPQVSGDTPQTYPAAIYSLVDLDIEGKGSLAVISQYNGGIYTKKDLDVKNLTLSVNASENSLRGNDSVTIEGGSTTVIATRGDAVKTTNSDISSKGNQRGNVTITGGIHNIYAAGDGISAAHDVIISDSTTVLNIYTDKYSNYTLLKTDVSSEKLYIRTTSDSLSYSVRFSNKDGSVAWSDATYLASYFIDGQTVYIYEADRIIGYSYISIYAYGEGQSPGQDVFYELTTYDIPINKGYDTVAIKELSNALGYRYTSFYLTENGNVTVDERSNRGIKASNSVLITGGSISISSHGDAIKANSDATLENGKKPLGDIKISGGNITVNTHGTAILAEGNLNISGGSVTVNSSFIGFGGKTVTTQGASTSVVAVYKAIDAKN